MNTIYKYELNFNDISLVAIPRNAKILHFDIQSRGPCLWCLVNTDDECIDYHFRVYETGSDVEDDSYDYIGTAFNGYFAYHLFLINKGE